MQLLSVKRKLVAPGKILVKPGDRVKHDTIIGKMNYIPGQMHRVPVAESLGVDYQEIENVILPTLGDWVEKDQVIAVNDLFYSRLHVSSPISGYLSLVSKYLGLAFIREPLPSGPKDPIRYSAEELGISKIAFATGFTVKQGTIVDKGRVLINSTKPPLVSPAVGRIREVSLTEGYFVLVPLYQSTELNAHLSGVVKQVLADDEVVIESYGIELQGLIGFGKESVGELMVYPDTNSSLFGKQVTEEVKGKVVLHRGDIERSALEKLAGYEAKGVILGAIDLDILHQFSREEPLVLHGHRMEIPFTIVVMQGFGQMMDLDTYAQLTKYHGKEISIDGATQLRAGVVRPRILIPLGEDDQID
jgi:hypothetical protein